MNSQPLVFSLQKLLCSIALLAIAGVPSWVGAVEITVVGVTDTSDPPAMCTGTDPVSCPSLRAAVLYANENPGEDTITLSDGTYTLSIPGVDESWTGSGTEADPYVAVIDADATQGDLDITDSVTINGAVDLNGDLATTITWDDSSITDPDIGDRIFHVQALASSPTAVSVTFSNLILTNGSVGVVPNTNCDVVDNPYDIEIIAGDTCSIYQFRRFGGAVALGPGANIAYYVQEEHGLPGGGGNKPPDVGPGGDEPDEGGTISDVTFNHVAIIGNSAGADGGGIYNAAPTTIEESVISGNFSGANGGGIYNDAKMQIDKTTIGTAGSVPFIADAAMLANPNQGENGGGLFDTGAHTTTIIDSSINGNTGIGGGGIAGRSLIVFNITNTTISGNIASDVGGGMTTNGTANFYSSTVVNNEASTDAPGGGAGLNSFGAGTYNLHNTIVADNVKQIEPTPVDSNCGCSGGTETCPSGRLVSLGHNLESADTCDLAFTGDLINTDPQLLALANNGGLTETHALQHTQNMDPVDSPAVDAGDTENCPNNDQRGSIRPANGNLDPGETFECDIGAFELFVPTADLHIENMKAPDKVNKGDQVTVVIDVHNPQEATSDTAQNVTINATVPDGFTDVTGSLLTDNDCTVTGSDVSCPVITSLGVGETATLTLVFTAANPGTFTVNTAVAADSPTDTRPGNNSASAHITVIGDADLSLNASTTQNRFKVGNQVTATIRVNNAGPDDASDVRLTSILPDSLQFVSATPDNGSTCSEFDGEVSCSLGDISTAAPDVNVELEVKVVKAGSITVAGAVTADQNDPDDDNNTGSVTITAEVPSEDKNENFFERVFGCTMGPGGTGFDPSLLLLVLVSLVHLVRREMEKVAVKK